MSKAPTTIESSELIRLRLQEKQSLLNDFLSNVKRMIKDQAALHLPKTLDPTQRLAITQPQAFLSYAWEADTEKEKQAHLHTFLKQLAAHLTTAGLTPWLDLQRMTGNLDKQMRVGIQKSQYALLIGTERYAERTKPSSDTNVHKELKFALEEYEKRTASDEKSADFLLPLMVEGDYGVTFPTVSKFLIRDGRSWYSLKQGQWQSFENYVQELTQPEPLGILPCLLGLNRLEPDLLKYRQACLKLYKQYQQAFMAQLTLLQKSQDTTDHKQNQSRPIQLTPVLQIPLQALEYDKKADKIGSGSYGEVYRGYWQGKQAVAIKELTGTLTAAAEKDLFREAGIMAHLSKVSTEPYHTVGLYGLAVEKPTYALVMEFISNGTLFDLLQIEAELPWDLRYQLAADIGEGIDFLHRNQILHRDLRSHNVLLTIVKGRLRAKLSDFGLSTVKNSVRTTTTIKKSDSIGTRAWMAPELHKRGGQSSPASDIYSYGMILWELLTRMIPFADAQDPSLISDWVTKGDTEIIPDNCPPKFAELIKKCWALKPENRITIIEIQKELEELVKAHPFSPGAQAIIENLQKIQAEKEEKWNTRWQSKQSSTKEEKRQQLEIECLNLVQEQQSTQLATAAEEKQQQEAENQTKIDHLTQEHQTELKSVTLTEKELKYNEIKQELKNIYEDEKNKIDNNQPPTVLAETAELKRIEEAKKSSPMLPTTTPISALWSSQTLMSAPKPQANAAQLQLQDQLITACEQGDLKTVQTLFRPALSRKIIARPDLANAEGKQPLGAAVWGMNPEVVKALLEQKSIACMTWKACKEHNLKKYKGVFIMPKFNPQTYEEWYELLKKIDFNGFLNGLHLEIVDKQWHCSETSSWENLKEYVGEKRGLFRSVVGFWSIGIKLVVATEKEYATYRMQIKQEIISATFNVTTNTNSARGYVQS